MKFRRTRAENRDKDDPNRYSLGISQEKAQSSPTRVQTMKEIYDYDAYKKLETRYFAVQNEKVR